MSLDFLTNYAVPVIVGICLCLGYILKNAVKTDKINPYIPLIMGITGVILSFWIEGKITPDILLGGLFSGLASTGLYEAFHNLITKKAGEE